MELTDHDPWQDPVKKIENIKIFAGRKESNEAKSSELFGPLENEGEQTENKRLFLVSSANLEIKD